MLDSNVKCQTVGEVVEELESVILYKQDLLANAKKNNRGSIKRMIRETETKIDFLLDVPMSTPFPNNCQYDNGGDIAECWRTYHRTGEFKKSNLKEHDIKIRNWTYEVKQFFTSNVIEVNPDTESSKTEFILGYEETYRMSKQAYKALIETYATVDKKGRTILKPNNTIREYIRTNGRKVD